MINKMCNKGITNAEYSIEYLFIYFYYIQEFIEKFQHKFLKRFGCGGCIFCYNQFTCYQCPFIILKFYVCSSWHFEDVTYIYILINVLFVVIRHH